MDLKKKTGIAIGTAVIGIGAAPGGAGLASASNSASTGTAGPTTIVLVGSEGVGVGGHGRFLPGRRSERATTDRRLAWPQGMASTALNFFVVFLISTRNHSETKCKIFRGIAARGSSRAVPYCEGGAPIARAFHARVGYQRYPASGGRGGPS